jgi:hypothetical protein
MSKPREVIPITQAERHENPHLIHLYVGCTHNVIDLRRGSMDRIGPAAILPFPAGNREKNLDKSPETSDPCHDRRAVKREKETMPTFTIDKENRIQVLNPSGAGDPDQTLIRFRSKQELEVLAKQWPAARLVEIWNGITGVTPVRKFTSRQIATTRIWEAIRNTVPESAGKAKTNRKAQTGENADAAEPSKKETVIALLSGGGQATIEQLVAATGWQKHSIRGFLSGTLKKKMGLKVLSSRNSEGQRVYRLK